MSTAASQYARPGTETAACSRVDAAHSPTARSRAVRVAAVHRRRRAYGSSRSMQGTMQAARRAPDFGTPGPAGSGRSPDQRGLSRVRFLHRRCCRNCAGVSTGIPSWAANFSRSPSPLMIASACPVTVERLKNSVMVRNTQRVKGPPSSQRYDQSRHDSSSFSSRDEYGSGHQPLRRVGQYIAGDAHGLATNRSDRERRQDRSLIGLRRRLHPADREGRLAIRRGRRARTVSRMPTQQVLEQRPVASGPGRSVSYRRRRLKQQGTAQHARDRAGNCLRRPPAAVGSTAGLAGTGGRCGHLGQDAACRV